MTYEFVRKNMIRIEREWIQFEDTGILKHGSIYLSQEFQIPFHVSVKRKDKDGIVVIELFIQLKRKRNNKIIEKYLDSRLCQNTSNHVLEYVGKYDMLQLFISILYDPLEYPWSSPIWRLDRCCIEGIDNRLSIFINYMIESHNRRLHDYWSIGNIMIKDILYFVSKFSKFMA